MKKMQLLIASLGLVLAMPALAQMREAPAPVGQASVTELTATVEDLDVADRMITLKGPAGNSVTTEVSPDVKNLDQVKVGDEVHVQYYTAVMVRGQKVEGPAVRAEEVIAQGAAVAEEGSLPAGVVGREVKETVEILGVDPYKKAIAFRPKDGKYREVSMDAPHLEGRLEEFKKGDMVAVTYREALAIFVEPK